MDNKLCKKREFRYKQDALKMLRRIMKRSTNNTVPSRAYLCDHCNKWHLTHLDSEDYLNMNSQNVKLTQMDAWKALLNNK